MLEKGFLHKQGHRGERTPGSRAVNLVLYAGVCIVLGSLLLMVMNVDKADGLIHLWLPFMIAGVVLIFMSLLIRLTKEWHRK